MRSVESRAGRYRKKCRPTRQTNSGVVLDMLGHFGGKYVLRIGLKASGNYLDQFWSNRISALFCEGRENIGKAAN